MQRNCLKVVLVKISIVYLFVSVGIVTEMALNFLSKISVIMVEIIEIYWWNSLIAWNQFLSKWCVSI